MSEHQEWTDQLSAYIDGELDPQRQAAVRRHLAGCASCSRAHDELVAVVDWAAGLDPQPAGRDGWPDLRARIEQGKAVALPTGSGSGRGHGWRALAAAAVLVAALSAGSVWIAMGGSAAAPPSDRTVAMPEMLEASTGDFDLAVRDLETLLAENRGQLDTATVRVVEESLRTIDRAIAEARAAVQQDSSQAYLNGRIAAHMRQKMAILRMAARAVRAEI